MNKEKTEMDLSEKCNALCNGEGIFYLVGYSEEALNKFQNSYLDYPYTFKNGVNVCPLCMGTGLKKEEELELVK